MCHRPACLRTDLFSGFGLGTILLPAFALFFPAEVAVSLTAIVHFLNNLFKLALLAHHAELAVVLRFGLPALISAFFGAQVLLMLADQQPIWHYHWLDHSFAVLPVNLVIGLLMIGFATLELLPAARSFSLPRKYLPLGGVLSGFFGGLSGHQGALRTIFLLCCGLRKEAFIATGVVIACLVDVSRLIVYADRFEAASLGQNLGLLIVATASAFTGAFIGNRLLTKVTMSGVRLLVAILLYCVAVLLAAGII